MEEQPVEGGGYLRWNDALATHFFNSANAGQQVRLQVDEDVVREVGGRIGAGIEGLVAAALAGPPWTTGRDPCLKALQALGGWRTRGLDFPPYVAYLSVFVLAASVEGDFAAHAYYPRLRSLLSMPGEGMLPHFERMLELWDDLEVWSVRDRNGDLGLFEAVISGGWIHVGLPLAQAVLTTGDRRVLPAIFAEADMDPMSPPTTGELFAAIRHYGAGLLRPRIMRGLESGTSTSASRALLDAVAEEFARWDGTAPEGDGLDGTSAGSTIGRLRLCLAFDPVSRRAVATLRANSNRPFPEEPLRLGGLGDDRQVECEAAMPGWSSPLLDAGTSLALRPTPAQWAGGLRLDDTHQRWELRLPPSEVRAFAEGTPWGLPGLVEVPRITPGRAFYLAFREAAWPALRSWAEGCTGWRRYEGVDGLPSGWGFGSAQAAVGAGPASFYSLGAPERVRIRLTGGLRLSAGHTYFPFALPSVAVDGATGDEDLICDGANIASVRPGMSYQLPDHPGDARITVEVRRADTTLARTSVFSSSSFNWRVREPISRADRFGLVTEQVDPWVSGAATSPGAAIADLPLDPLRAPGLDPGCDRTFLIGRRPDQVACWPSEPVPNSWAPVWAVSIRRHGTATFCGPPTGEFVPLPLPPDSAADPRWRCVLWTWRRRISPPTGSAGRLWKDYQEAARRDHHR